MCITVPRVIESAWDHQKTTINRNQYINIRGYATAILFLLAFLKTHLYEWHLLQSKDDLVESGEEQYYPALQVGPVGSSFSVVSTDLNAILPACVSFAQSACNDGEWLTDFFLCSHFGWISLQNKVAETNVVTTEE